MMGTGICSVELARTAALCLVFAIGLAPRTAAGQPSAAVGSPAAVRAAPPAAVGRIAVADGGMVVSASRHASLAGRHVLRDGGSAVDAAVTVALTLAVTWPEAGNLGGGGFMLIRPAGGGKPVCVDYRETAPAAATPTMYDPDESRFTHRAVGVPGTVRGLATAHDRYGRLPWRRLVRPALRLAREGFPIDQHLASSINGVLGKAQVQSDERYAELRRVFAPPEGDRWVAGQRLVQPELAATLERLADGAESFYAGPTAELLVEEMRRGDGLITAADLAGYKAVVRAPVRGRYRDCEILGAPPPSSGGIAIVEALNILENFDLRGGGRRMTVDLGTGASQHVKSAAGAERSPEPATEPATAADAAHSSRYAPEVLHLIAESLRRAFRDRALHLGDSDFVPICPQLTDKHYARQLAEELDTSRATPSEKLAPPIALAEEPTDTTHFSVIDADGMAVANTYTLEASWGSYVVVRGAGFLLNNEMGDFNWVPGYTDRQGRIGTPPNLIAPNKRMLSSMSPTIVVRDGRVLLITGSPGGRTIISTVLQIVLNVVEFEMALPQAIDALRQHHQWFPDRFDLEQLDDPSYVSAVHRLRAMGHELRGQGQQGSAHSIWINPASGDYQGVADRRRGGWAAGIQVGEIREPAARRRSAAHRP